jgi:two-component system response regulator ResD
MARVLVVEDDPTVAEVVGGYLRRAGFEVDTASDGHAALAAATPELPDLVVLDLMLAGIDGLQVCRRLRRRGPVPVIMLTALGEESERVVGLEIGADDYVTKPFSLATGSLALHEAARAIGAGEPVSMLRGRVTA